MASLTQVALALVVARRAVEQRRLHHVTADDDFSITLCSPCPGGHDDGPAWPRDFSRGFELHLVVVDTED